MRKAFVNLDKTINFVKRNLESEKGRCLIKRKDNFSKYWNTLFSKMNEYMSLVIFLYLLCFVQFFKSLFILEFLWYVLYTFSYHYCFLQYYIISGRKYGMMLYVNDSLHTFQWLREPAAAPNVTGKAWMSNYLS